MSAEATSLGIVSWGAVSSLARTARQTGFYLRAGRKYVAPSPFIDLWGERIPMAFNPTLSSSTSGRERMVRLAADALAPAWSNLGRRARRPRLALALPELYAASPELGGLNEEGLRFVDELRSRMPAELQAEPLAALPFGRAAGIKAVEQARAWLHAGEADVALVGGLDTYYDWTRLECVIAQDRLLNDDNLDGFYPGEGAAFVAVTAGANGDAVARIAGAGSAMERDSVLSQAPPQAEGSSRALRDAVSELRALRRRCNYWLLDVTHEQYGVKELQILIARFGDVLGLNASLQMPLQGLGNIGAAALPMFCVLACESWLRCYAPDRYAVCLAGSDSGLRGALLLEGSHERDCQ